MTTSAGCWPAPTATGWRRCSRRSPPSTTSPTITIVAAADVLGFRHLYYGQGEDFAVLSTSARAVGACLGNDLDREAIALQSLLGWQVGQRTLFGGVHKLGPASSRP